MIREHTAQPTHGIRVDRDKLCTRHRALTSPREGAEFSTQDRAEFNNQERTEFSNQIENQIHVKQYTQRRGVRVLIPKQSAGSKNVESNSSSREQTQHEQRIGTRSQTRLQTNERTLQSGDEEVKSGSESDESSSEDERTSSEDESEEGEAEKDKEQDRPDNSEKEEMDTSEVKGQDDDKSDGSSSSSDASDVEDDNQSDEEHGGDNEDHHSSDGDDNQDDDDDDRSMEEGDADDNNPDDAEDAMPPDLLEFSCAVGANTSQKMTTPLKPQHQDTGVDVFEFDPTDAVMTQINVKTERKIVIPRPFGIPQSQRKPKKPLSSKRKMVKDKHADDIIVPVGPQLLKFLNSHETLKDVCLSRGKRNIKRELVTVERDENAVTTGTWNRGQKVNERCRYDDHFVPTEKGRQLMEEVQKEKARNQFVVAWYLWCPGQGNCKRKCGGYGICARGE